MYFYSRAYERIGNAYSKSGDLKQALKNYQDSLSEQINQNVLLKKQEIEKKMSAPENKDSMHKRLDQLNKIGGGDGIFNDKEALDKLKDKRTFSEMFPNLRKEDYYDNRVQPYVLDRLPNACDLLKCTERLNNMFEMTRFTKFYESYVKMKDFQVAPVDLVKRLSDTCPETLAWYSKCVRGSINKNYIDAPYDPRVLHSYTNEPIRSETLPANALHVSVGFTDLSMFFNVQYWEEWSREKPLKWFGYEASAYCVAKTAVIVAMIESGASTEQIMQVWYSAAWSWETLKAFRAALMYLKNSKLNF